MCSLCVAAAKIVKPSAMASVAITVHQGALVVTIVGPVRRRSSRMPSGTTTTAATSAAATAGIG